MNETIDHATFNKLAEAGAINSVQVVAQPGGWILLIRYGHIESQLTTQRSRKTRLFKRLESLVIYLKDLGIERFDIDSSGFDPQIGPTGTRPDRSAALKRAHEAAAYEQWFSEQVLISQNDDSPSLDHQQVREIFAARKRALLKE